MTVAIKCACAETVKAAYLRMPLKIITPYFIICLALMYGHNTYAQCTATITNAGKGCVGDTLHINAAGAARVSWRRGNRLLRTDYAYKPSTYGSTVAGNKNDTAGNSSAALDYPSGVWLDSKGNVFVADFNNNRVQKWAPGATNGSTVAGQKDGTSGTDSAHLDYPSGVFVDDSDNVYVADEFNNRVQKWKAGDTFGITVAGQSDGTGGYDSAHLYTPTAVYVDKHKNVYVADYNRVQKWAPGAKYGTTVAGRQDGTPGHDSTYLNNSVGVFVDTAGNVYVADASNNRVSRWAPGAKYGVCVAGEKYDTTLGGSDSFRLSNPFGLYVDDSHNVYVADADNKRVQKWAPGAKWGVTVAGKYNNTAGGDSAHLSFALAVFVDANRTVYVADAGNNRIQKWEQILPPVKLITDSAGAYSAIVVFESGCTDTTTADSIAFCSTGLAHIPNSLDRISIYPNPNAGQYSLDIHTKNTADKATIQILNLLGQVIDERTITHNTDNLHLILNNDRLQQGVYLVKVSMGAEVYTARMVVNK